MYSVKYNLVLVTWHFECKVEVFFKEIRLDGLSGKIKYSAIRIEFEKGVSHMFIIRWYGFLMHQIIKMKLPKLSLLIKKNKCPIAKRF